MRSNNNRSLVVGILIVLALAAGCSPASIDSSAGATPGGIGGGGGGTAIPTLISIIPDANSILINTSTFVRATVRDQNGVIMSGVIVSFMVTSGTGTLASGVAVTDATGLASDQFIASAFAGPVGIQASVTSVTPVLASNITTISVTAAAVADPASLAVSSNPTDIDVGGTSTISVLVRDSSGNLLSNKNVDFTFDLGAGLGVFSASSGTTDGSGMVTTSFVAGTSPGTVTIRATAAGFPAVTSTASVRINSLPASISATVVSPNISTLSSTNIRAQVLNSAGQQVSDGTIVEFTSADTRGGSLTASATTVAGYANATFQASNNDGQVTVTVSCPVGTAAPYDVVITILQPTIGSIQFVSADPNIIGVKSAGQNVTSTVTFAVKTTTGSNAPDGTRVRFTMTGPNGGEYIGDPDATPAEHEASIFEGIASIIVNSGNVAGPIRIIATVLDASGNPTAVTTGTAAVSIGGGFPSARHFSMATSLVNLPGLNWYGREATLTVYVADRFGNYNVMPATTVSFYIEAGGVDASNVTDSVGMTTSIVRTQGPEPVDVAPAPWEQLDSYVAIPNGFTEQVTYNFRDGWVRVMAVTRGEEKFIDLNGNGLYDSPEPFDDLSEPFVDANNDGVYSSVTETFADSNNNGKYDRGEPFTDTNGNGVRDEAEFYIDTNQNGQHDAPNALWDSDTNIWTSMDLVFSGTPIIDFSIPRYDVCASTYEPYFDNNGTGTWEAGELYSDVNQNGTWDNISSAPACQDFTLYIHDLNMNCITGSSTVTITTTAGNLSAGSVNTATIPDGFSTEPYMMDLTICDSWLPPGDSEYDAGPQSGGVKVDLKWNIFNQFLNVQKSLPGTAY